MKHLLPLTFLTLLFFTHSALGQNYIGHSIDNFSGIHGVMYNPANIVESNFKTDVNLISASTFLGSDYFGINFSDITDSEGEFEFEDDVERSPSNTNNFFSNVDVMGPSFMFNLSPKSSIGIITRGRGFLNINNINGELYESISDNFDTDEDFDFDSNDLTGTVHVWAEIGLAYGRILMDKTNHLLKGGVTLKYLQGAGSVFLNSPELQGQYTANNETLETQGSLMYGTTRGFDNDDINFDNLSAGFGLDIGFAYQWHPNKTEDDEKRYFQDPYKLKLGISVTDIGSIKYDNSEVTTYDLNATVNAASFDEDTEEFLDDNYTSTTEARTAKLNLPTALHLLVDYRLAKKWLISAQADLALTKKNAELGNSVINTITVAPRLETKWFSLYVPASLRQYGDFAFGAGFRLGPLTVGSGSVLSNLISDSSKTTDIYFGLKIPIYRK